MVSNSLQSLSRWAGLAAACSLLASCSTAISPGSVRDLEQQTQAATQRRVEPGTARVVQQPDGRQTVVIGNPGAVPPPPQIAAPAPAPAARPASIAQAAPPTAAPVAPPASALGTPPATPAISLRDTIEGWRGAWARGDAEAYFKFYAPEAKGNAKTRAAWEQQRRQRLANTGIEVQFEDIRYDVRDNDADVHFVQHYKSARHADTGKKHIKLRRVDGAWRIVAENWEPVKAAPKTKTKGKRTRKADRKD
jgi:ketosteroid isomerase-like protein